MLSSVGRLVAGELTRLEFPAQRYLSLIDSAFGASAPHYASESFGTLFRHKGRNATWLASLLASDSYMEGYSAVRLWQYAASLSDPDLARRMRRHAADEAKHSALFASTLLQTFPTLDCPTLREHLRTNSPDLNKQQTFFDSADSSDHELLLRSMILINLYEIKALILGHLLKPVVIAHCPPHNRDTVSAMLGQVISDETQHIRYTAAFIESQCNSGRDDFIAECFSGFQATLNQVTQCELETDSALTI